MAIFLRGIVGETLGGKSTEEDPEMVQEILVDMRRAQCPHTVKLKIPNVFLVKCGALEWMTRITGLMY